MGTKLVVPVRFSTYSFGGGHWFIDWPEYTATAVYNFTPSTDGDVGGFFYTTDTTILGYRDALPAVGACNPWAQRRHG